MKTKPIDVLILEDALDKGRVTATQEAVTWGEDCQRVAEWLDRFYRIGLMHRHMDFYWVLRNEAKKYLATRRQPIP